MKKIYLVVLGLIMAYSTYACDVCGCNPNGIGINLVDNYIKNYVNVSYSTVKFRKEDILKSTLYDYFSSVTISGRYHLTPKIKLQASLPYSFNTRKQGKFEGTETGIGDLRLDVFYNILEGGDMKQNYYIEIGTGISLPTGAYNKDIVDENNLPLNFNAGRKTLGQTLTLNGNFQRGAYSIGLNSSFNYYYKKDNYKHGNQLVTYLTFSRTSIIGNHRFIPNIKFGYENTKSDTNAIGANFHGTGGKMWTASAGVTYSFSRFMVSGNYFHPLSSSYSDGESSSDYRLQTQITYLF